MQFRLVGGGQVAVGRWWTAPLRRLVATSDALSAKQNSRWDSVCYRFGMTIQIAVRLPDEMVAFLDDSVASGVAPSRAALVASALEREMRRQLALHDAKILRDAGSDDDLDDLVAWSVSHADLGE